MYCYYIDTDEIPGFFLLLKNHIFIARSEDTIFISTCEDIGVAMVTNIIFLFSIRILTFWNRNISIRYFQQSKIKFVYPSDKVMFGFLVPFFCPIVSLMFCTIFCPSFRPNFCRSLGPFFVRFFSDFLF